MSTQFQRNKRYNLKEECLNYLGGKICAICSTDWLPACCYDFHHKSGFKDENISKMIARKKTLDLELRAELDKCTVSCSNCHRQISYRIVPIETLKGMYN